MEVKERQGKSKNRWEINRKEFYERKGMSIKEVEIRRTEVISVEMEVIERIRGKSLP